MLVYVRRPDVTKDTMSTGPVARTPPRHVMTAVDELNDRYHRKCEEYNTRLSGKPVILSELLTCFTDKRLSWSVSPRSGNKSWIFTVHGKRHPLQRSGTPRLCLPSLTALQAVVVSKQSLEKWLARNQTCLPQPTGEDVGALEEISISDILCEHGALDPSQASSMKCINEVSVEFAVRDSKLDRKTRLPTRTFWIPDASSRRCSTLITSAQFASRRHIKVRNLQRIETLRYQMPITFRKAIPARASPLGLHF